MNPAHLHLLVNHIPVFGTLGAALLLAWGVLRKNDEVLRVGLILMVLIAVATWGVQLTGDPAEEAVEHLPGVTRQLIHAHEEAAELSTIVIAIAGISALVTLFLVRGRRAAGRAMSIVTMVIGLAGFGLVARAANLGGAIRHTEIRPGGAGAEAVERDEH